MLLPKSNSVATVSVLVLNFNGVVFLSDCLSSLQGQSYCDFDIWLIDNGSTDGSAEFVKKEFPRVKILALESNYGFCGAYNRAVALIKTPFFVLLNNDTVVDKRWLEYLVVMAQDERADVVGSKILSHAKPQMILSAGLMMTPAGVAYEIGLGMEDTPESPYNQPRPIGGVSGASMLIRTEAFRALNGFDERYFAFCEDLDLCWRAHLSGRKVFYQPASRVYHHSGGTAGRDQSLLRVYFMQKNMIRTALKHFGFLGLLKAFGVIGVYTVLRFLLYLITQKDSLAKSLVCGSLEPWGDLPQILKARAEVQRSRVVSDKKLREQGWISSILRACREYARTRSVFKGQRTFSR